MSLSVIVCTYNPNDDLFMRVLNALGSALAKVDGAEFLIVDNNSRVPVAHRVYVKSFIELHGGRVVVEKEQGLTHARLRGIEETSGEILVFIDDDNIVDVDFLQNGLAIAKDFTFIGSWSGRVELEFETQPPEWTRRYWGMLVHRQFSGSKWSNIPDLPETMPCGAGLYVRRGVCEKYAELHAKGERGIVLDRAGDSLLSGGDNDLAVCACDMGMGVGLFDSISLVHYIPSSRLQLSYLSRLAEGISLSDTVLKYYRGKDHFVRESLKTRLANSVRMWLMAKPDRNIYKSVLAGRKKAMRMISDMESVKR